MEVVENLGTKRIWGLKGYHFFMFEMKFVRVHLTIICWFHTIKTITFNRKQFGTMIKLIRFQRKCLRMNLVSTRTKIRLGTHACAQNRRWANARILISNYEPQTPYFTFLKNPNFLCILTRELLIEANRQ